MTAVEHPPETKRVNILSAPRISHTRQFSKPKEPLFLISVVLPNYITTPFTHSDQFCPFLFLEPLPSTPEGFPRLHRTCRSRRRVSECVPQIILGYTRAVTSLPSLVLSEVRRPDLPCGPLCLRLRPSGVPLPPTSAVYATCGKTTESQSQSERTNTFTLCLLGYQKTSFSYVKTEPFSVVF